MNPALLNEIVHAVLYEGYILYPYRASSVKNQRERFTFGRVYPQIYNAAQNGAEPCVMQTQCLVASRGVKRVVEVSVRFLQPVWRKVGVPAASISDWTEGTEPELAMVPELQVGEMVYRTWQEAIEREVKLPVLKPPAGREEFPFYFDASRTLEPIRDEQGRVMAVLVRQTEAIQGMIEIDVAPLRDEICRVSVRLTNLSSLPASDLENQDAVILRTFASTHTILHAQGAEFVSLLDPPAELKTAAAACQNVGTWPVLVGDEEKHERDTVLSSPIILYDYPRVAPESRGDLFDNTEIDEILTLRIMTMTDEEKREMRNVDARARRLLERTEAMPQEDLLAMHGVMRKHTGGPATVPGKDAASPRVCSFDEQIFGSSTPLQGASVNGTYVTRGHRVRIRPKARADVMDIALAGRTAVIEAVEQDAEQRIHLALVLEDDPGKDLGMLRQTGHRFFYGLEEVELVEGVGEPLNR